jgi:hypothetical protein
MEKCTDRHRTSRESFRDAMGLTKHMKGHYVPHDVCYLTYLSRLNEELDINFMNHILIFIPYLVPTGRTMKNKKKKKTKTNKKRRSCEKSCHTSPSPSCCSPIKRRGQLFHKSFWNFILENRRWRKINYRRRRSDGATERLRKNTRGH